MAEDVGKVEMKDLAHFSRNYRWLWDGQLTKFFSEEWWNRIPQEVLSLHFYLATENSFCRINLVNNNGI